MIAVESPSHGFAAKRASSAANAVLKRFGVNVQRGRTQVRALPAGAAMLAALGAAATLVVVRP